MNATAAAMAKIAEATSISIRLKPLSPSCLDIRFVNTLASVPPPGSCPAAS